MTEVSSSEQVKRILERFKQMETEKALWLPMYQLCAEYVMSRKQGFTTTLTQGQIQTDHIFDSTAENANSLMAAALIGAMWPNGAKSLRLSMPFGMEEELGEETEEVKRYYQEITKRQAYYMDVPKAGLMTALEEYMLDQGAFGISGILVIDNEDDFDVPLLFKAVDAKALHIDEGRNGFVDVIYLQRELTTRQLVEEYGVENVSKCHREAFLKGEQMEKVKVLQAIEPRLDIDPYAFGVEGMPYSSIHIDLSTEKILKESGFPELPLVVVRFWKAMGEKYGRCPAMQAMSAILEANSLGEMYILAGEKSLDPPIMVFDDSVAGGGVIDTGPRGMNVISASGRIPNNVDPIKPLFLVGDMNWTAARRTELAEIIKNHFFVDRLMDLNNEQRMTLGEANIRDSLRGQTLNTTYSRQYSEGFHPLIEISFNRLLRRGLMGVIQGSKEERMLLRKGISPLYIPDVVIKRILTGREVYKIEFISPAMRIMHSEELQGIEHLLTVVSNMAQIDPTILDNIDKDWALRRIQELDGAPRETLVSEEQVRVNRQVRQQQQQAMTQMEAARQNSETARNIGQAVSSVQNVK